MRNPFQKVLAQPRLQAAQLLALLAFPFATYLLLLTNPLPRQIGLSLRYEFSSMVILLGLAFLGIFILRGWRGALFGLTVTLAAFALPLNGLWSSAISEPVLLGGLIPWSDANGYYLDALRVLEGFFFSSFSSRRPLFPGLLATLLGLTGQNLQVVLAILVAINAFSLYLLAREVRRTHGPLVAATVLLLLFIFYRRFNGTVMTENLGFPLGALGLALLWRSDRLRQSALALGGIFLVALALNARSGAFLTLPMLIFWGAWRWRGARRLSWAFLGLGLLAAGLGFAANSLVFRLLGDPNDMLFSNFSEILYGMAVGGKGWMQVWQDHPEVMTLPEAVRSQRVYELAFEAIRSNPFNLLGGMLTMWQLFFGTTTLGAFGFVGGADSIILFASKSVENKGFHVAARIALYALSILGIFQTLRRRERPGHLLTLAACLGVIFSVPFVPPWDGNGMRAYAATLPFQVCLPALGLAFLIDCLLKTRLGKIRFFQRMFMPAGTGQSQKASKTFKVATNDEISEAGDSSDLWLRTIDREAVILPVFSSLLVLLTLLGPLALKLSTKPVNINMAICPSGQEAAAIRLSPGTFIRVSDDDIISHTWLPDIPHDKFISSIHDFMYTEVPNELDHIDIPAVILSTFELKVRRQMILVGNADAAPAVPGLYTACGHWSQNPDVAAYGFFYARFFIQAP